MRSGTERLRLACLMLAAALPYLNALSAGFTFDDRGAIVENSLVHGAALPLATVFTEPYQPGALYRPLTFLSFWANHRVHGLTPFGFHAVNVVLHMVATLLVYHLARSMRLAGAVPFVAALLFAVHPIHTEAVTSIVGRAELLAAIAVLGALLCAARSRGQGVARGRWLAAAAALFALGLLCKESAFVFLPLLVVSTWITDRRSPREILVGLNLSGELPLFTGIGVAYLALRWTLFGTLTSGAEIAWLDNPLAHTSLAARIGTASMILVDSLAQMIAPLQLAADYSYAQIPLVGSLADPRLWIALGVLAAAGGVLWELRRSTPAAAGGALFFLAAFSLTANLLFPIGTIRAERLLYLPSVGFCLVAGAGAAWALARNPRGALAVIAMVVLVFGARTWARNGEWHSDETLFAATLQASPRSAKVHHNLGALREEAHDWREAALWFRRALAIYPDYDDAAFGIGHSFDRRDMKAGAMRWYGRALEINPRHAMSHLNRGVILFNGGDLDAAGIAFRRGLETSPRHPRLLTGIGMIHLAEGRIEEAQRVFEIARNLAPEDPEPRRGLELAAQRAALAGQGS